MTMPEGKAVDNPADDDISFKSTVVRMAPSIAAILFTKVENEHNTIFDSSNLKLTQQEINQKINFLKHLKLIDMSFENVDKPLFIIRNKQTGDFIEITNRLTGRELRGVNLRQALIDGQAKNPNQMAYDALNDHMIQPQNADVVLAAKTSLCQAAFGECLTESHFNLYVGLVLSAVKERSYIHRDVVIASPEAAAELVLREVKVGELYDLGLKYSNILQHLEEQAAHYQQIGNTRAVHEAQDLIHQFHVQEQQLFEGAISTRTFSNHIAEIQALAGILHPMHATYSNVSLSASEFIKQEDEKPQQAESASITTNEDALQNIDKILDETMGYIDELDKAFDIQRLDPSKTNEKQMIEKTKQYKESIKDLTQVDESDHVDEMKSNDLKL